VIELLLAELVWNGFFRVAPARFNCRSRGVVDALSPTAAAATGIVRSHIEPLIGAIGWQVFHLQSLKG